jgi:hypothetical protein
MYVEKFIDAPRETDNSVKPVIQWRDWARTVEPLPEVLTIREPLPNGMVKDNLGEFAYPGIIRGAHEIGAQALKGTPRLETVYSGRVKRDMGAPIGDYEKIAPKLKQDNGTIFADGHKCKDAITCRALFLSGANNADSFNRIHALAYVTKALIFSSGHGSAAAREVSVETHVGKGKAPYRKTGKTSSFHVPQNATKPAGNKLSKHVNESIVEDIVQNAAALFFARQAKGKEVNTRSACRFACAKYRYAKRLEKNSTVAFLKGEELETVKAKREREETRQGKLAIASAHLKMDALTEKMLTIIEQEGNANVQTLATGLNVTRATVYSWLKKLNKEMS